MPLVMGTLTAQPLQASAVVAHADTRSKMGSAASTKLISELDEEDIQSGLLHVKSMGYGHQLTGKDIVSALTQDGLRKAEISALKERVKTLEEALSEKQHDSATLQTVDTHAAREAIESGLSASELASKGVTAAVLRAAGVEISMLKDAGFSAEDCQCAGYSPQQLYPLCANFPLNDETSPTFDPAYNKLSILHMNGKPIVTETAFGRLTVASWSPDMYAAPPAWTRSEDGWDIRNRKKARILEWQVPEDIAQRPAVHDDSDKVTNESDDNDESDDDD